ncbi:hypothetical protein DsansV1_C04g0045221 [Dioscorea sansibarensis]
MVAHGFPFVFLISFSFASLSLSQFLGFLSLRSRFLSLRSRFAALSLSLQTLKILMLQQ